ncbi:MAG: hypothetical protein AVDCRST_MAG88-1629, partial [uncultured Thermomicrobiales bacterium]
RPGPRSRPASAARPRGGGCWRASPRACGSSPPRGAVAPGSTAPSSPRARRRWGGGRAISTRAGTSLGSTSPGWPCWPRSSSSSAPATPV